MLNTEVAITQSIMNLVSDGIIMMSDIGTITTINPAAVRMFAFASAQEVVGHHIKLLIPDLFPHNRSQSKDSKIFGIGRKAQGRRKDASVFSMMITITETYIAGRKEFVGVMREMVERKRVAPVLLDQMVDLQAVIHHLPDQVWIKDLQSRYLITNRAYAESVGKLAEEIQGLTDYDLFSEKTALETQNDDAHVIAVGEEQIVEEKTVDPHGEASYLRRIKIPIKNDQGKILGILGISRDISDLKRAEELCTRLERILDDTIFEVYIFDALSMKFVHVNQSGCKNSRFDLEELQALTPLDIMAGYTVESFEALLEPLFDESEETIRFEASIRRKDGTFYPADVLLQISRTENPPLFMAIIQDSTGRKEVEEALRKAERSLLYSQVN
jgi:PAS domain S-box-containing protein